MENIKLIEKIYKIKDVQKRIEYDRLIRNLKSGTTIYYGESGVISTKRNLSITNGFSIKIKYLDIGNELIPVYFTILEINYSEKIKSLNNILSYQLKLLLKSISFGILNIIYILLIIFVFKLSIVFNISIYVLSTVVFAALIIADFNKFKNRIVKREIYRAINKEIKSA